MLDMLIKGGMVVDGTESPGFYAAVTVEGDTIRILRGDVSGVKAKRVLDATGRVVCPGFIDLHAHSALMILHDPKHLPKVHQGVTTELIGIDGNSYAPFAKRSDLQDFIQLNSGLEGAPPIKATWSSVSDYLAVYDGKVSVNIAYIVGNSPLRIGAMGWNDRKPTAKEMDKMKGLLRGSMEEGAFGMSTGLDYPPRAATPTPPNWWSCRRKGPSLVGSTTPMCGTPSVTAILTPTKKPLISGAGVAFQSTSRICCLAVTAVIAVPSLCSSW